MKTAYDCLFESRDIRLEKISKGAHHPLVTPEYVLECFKTISEDEYLETMEDNIQRAYVGEDPVLGLIFTLGINTLIASLPEKPKVPNV